MGIIKALIEKLSVINQNEEECKQDKIHYEKDNHFLPKDCNKNIFILNEGNKIIVKSIMSISYFML